MNKARSFAIAIIIILSTLVFACGDDDSLEARKAAVSITTTKLATEYRQNEARADMEYKDKFVNIEGRVSEIESGGTFSRPHIVLHAGRSGFDEHEVYAYFDNENALVSFDKGDNVTLNCKVSGKDDKIFGGITIDIEKCLTIESR